MKRSTIKSSATFARTEVSEIGRRCLLISFTGFCFGSGTTSASFDDCGTEPSLNEEFKISFTGSDNNSAISFNSQSRNTIWTIGLSRIEFDQLHQHVVFLVTEKTTSLLSGFVLRENSSGNGEKSDKAERKASLIMLAS